MNFGQDPKKDSDGITPDIETIPEKASHDTISDIKEKILKT
jgi:hypothetical protein